MIRMSVHAPHLNPAEPLTYNNTNSFKTGGTRTLSAKLTEERGPTAAAGKGKGAGGEAKEAKVDEFSVAVQMVGERPLADIVNYVTQRGATTRPQDAINALDVVLKEVRALALFLLFVGLCVCVCVPRRARRCRS